jgi:hypothetical protein
MSTGRLVWASTAWDTLPRRALPMAPRPRALTQDEQQRMHEFVRRLLSAAAADDRGGSR